MITLASKILTSHILEDYNEVRATHSEHLHTLGSQVVDLNCCDELMAPHSLLHSHDLPPLEVFGRPWKYSVPLYFSVFSQHYMSLQ